MNDKEIFNLLFKIAASSSDPKGVACACLVRGGVVMSSSASSDDGVGHAEYILLGDRVIEDDNVVLYITLEPCSERSDINNESCVSKIISSGIKSVVFGASDPGQSGHTTKLLKEAGIRIKQVDDTEIIRRSAELFNTTVDSKFSETEVPRKPLV